MRADGKKTHLAATFYLVSMLYRQGAKPTPPVGDEKTADMVVARNNTHLTIDVRGALRAINFEVDYDYHQARTHYYVFVCYMGKFSNVAVMPEVYIVPSKDIAPLIQINEPKKRRATRGVRHRFKTTKF